MATARTSPAKRTRPEAPGATAPFEPVRIGRKSKTTDPGIVLFYLTGDDGEDVPYRIPAKVPTGLTLEFLRLARTMGENAAAQRLLERLLGSEAYLALEQSDEVGEDELQQIVDAAITHLAGPVDESGKDRA